MKARLWHSPHNGGPGVRGDVLYALVVIACCIAVMTVGVSLGNEIGRKAAFAEMAALAEDAYLRNQSGQGDVFTACMIEGWSQHDEFRREWADRKVGAN